MRLVPPTVALFVSAVTALPAQQAQPGDTSLPTGTHVRFWSPKTHGWLEGTVLRFYPNSGGVCLGVHSDALAGFHSIQHIDSLQAAGTTPRASAPAAAAQPWHSVPLAPLRAKEPKTCSS